jgi:glycerol-3-phosphate dehydrogenase
MTLGTRDNPYDLVIVGGGINGAGIARDATLRGLDVALFEKNDFSNGATWASSGFIHGGLRYLSDDPTVTKKSCKDSGQIQQIAPHLLFRVPFIMPRRDGGWVDRAMLELIEVYFDTYDRYSSRTGGKPHPRLTGEEARRIEPGLPEDVLGAVTTDEWGIDASRLTIANAVDAAERGAEIQTYHEVVDFLIDNGGSGERGAMNGVRVRDNLKGGTREVHARHVFNATGPWAEQFARKAGATRCRVRPGKGIHLVLSGRITNYALISHAIDGRQVFIAPQQNVTYVGTTDDDYWGDLDDIPILEDEVEYLLDAVERVYPDVRDHRIIDTTVGCRPTLHERGPYESDLSRDHEIFDHSEEGIPNFWSIAGGKLAAYRMMAEEAVDVICEQPDIQPTDPECSTHDVDLPGGNMPKDPNDDAWDELVESFRSVDLDPWAARRIVYRHGSRSRSILENMQSAPETTRLVDPTEPVTEAEIRYVLDHELVRHIDDLRRRCRVGCGPDGGWFATRQAARVFCDHRGRPTSHIPELAAQYQRRRWKDRRGILSGDQLAAEELGQSWSFDQGPPSSADPSVLVHRDESTAQQTPTTDSTDEKSPGLSASSDSDDPNRRAASRLAES